MADEALARRIAGDLALPFHGVLRTIALLDDGNTIPFIARYRKELTGSLDEVKLGAIEHQLGASRALEARRAEVYRLIKELGRMDPTLARAIAEAASLQALDDLYRPYRPKRRTKASIARERGLAPLAEIILAQVFGDRAKLAAAYVDIERGLGDAEEALAGARDVVAEVMAEDAVLRGKVRTLYLAAGEARSSVTDTAKDPGRVYEQYYAFHGGIASLPAHSILALNRAERQGVVRIVAAPPEDLALAIIAKQYPTSDQSELAEDLRRARRDSWERLLGPSLERETRAALTARAESHAIEVFARNLRPLLLQPPMRGKTVIGIDPGYRTGCKVAVVDPTGKPLRTTVIYPHPPQQRRLEAKTVLKELVRAHQATVFAIGAGTAARETEEVVAEVVAAVAEDTGYALVDEAGASVYSVSEIAREEFPALDATERSAISIARRLQDPLAELVKVDPRAVGVGLYQHDVDQTALAGTLDQVVERAVTFAGVDVNTASAALLHRVAGLNRKVAAAIVHYREEHGAFACKADLRRVPGIGPRAFEQAAGFLQVRSGPDVLDRTFIHPESYAACRMLIAVLPEGEPGSTLPARAGRCLAEVATRPATLHELAQSLGIGGPTLVDLLENLAKPGLDPRLALPQPLLRTAALSLEALPVGAVLQGTVRNVVDFGAFVDIGLKQAGLVHVSEMANRFVSSPLDIVVPGQVVRVRVLSVDSARGRIALSMKAVS